MYFVSAESPECMWKSAMQTVRRCGGLCRNGLSAVKFVKGIKTSERQSRLALL